MSSDRFSSTSPYVSGSHLNNVGSYIAACTLFATLYGDNPKGPTTKPYGDIDPKVAEVIHDVVWKVVSTHELAGLRK